MSGAPSDFLDRARAEAARYGSDPWIFVRELLQNARDAGARTVVITTGREGDREWVSCRDDGEGMSFEHARRYLFTLYASSKEGAKQAGQFGVGFWSVLRFEPESIVVRSWPRKSGAWEITLDGGLRRAARGPAPPPPRGMRSATEVLLVRPAGDGHLPRRIHDAVWQSSRYLSRRDDPAKAITLLVDGRRANAPFELPAPSASFRRGAVRGVVGLGKEARVELFSKGLRVRSAPMLDDLLSASGRSTGASRVSFPELDDGLAPQALLEDPGLELMLSRSDVRAGKTLEKTVATAQRELERLIERQLASSRPPSLARRALDLLSAVPPAASVAAVAAAAAVLVLATGRGTPEVESASAPVTLVDGPPARTAPAPGAAYRDLGALYAGPRADTIDRAGAGIPLRYAPADRDLHFGALVVPSLDAEGRPAGTRADLGVYESARCRSPHAPSAASSCVDVELPVDAPAGTLRLPTPSGHRVVARTIRFDGQDEEPTPRLVLGATHEGEAVIVSATPLRGLLRYSTAPALPPTPRGPAAVPPLPPAMAKLARSIRERPRAQRVAEATYWVRRHVRYSVEPGIAARHAEARARGEPFLERTLAIGAGDCDVQNGMLVLLLQSAGVDARLVVGFLGVGGRARPWLHAWVEWRDPSGPWRVVDASGGASPFGAADTGAVAAAPAAPPPAVSAPDTDGASPSAAAPDEAGGEHALGAPPARRVGLPAARTLGLALAGAMFLAGVGLTLGGRTRRSTRLDPAHDLSKLLRGALVQPDAFRHVPSLFHRPLIPLEGGARGSLAEAWVLATKRRLYVTRARSPLARSARRAGAVVLDGASPEGATVAEALGAVDLDHWDAVLRGARTHTLLELVAREVRREGEDWRLRLHYERSEPRAAGSGLRLHYERSEPRAAGSGLRLSQAGAGIDVVDVPAGRGRIRRWVVVGPEEPFFATAAGLLEARPAEALFRAADGLLDRLDLDEAARRRLLSRLAAAAVEEAAR